MKTTTMNPDKSLRDQAEAEGYDGNNFILHMCKAGMVVTFYHGTLPDRRMVVSVPGHLGKVAFLENDESPGYEEEEVRRLGGLEEEGDDA